MRDVCLGAFMVCLIAAEAPGQDGRTPDEQTRHVVAAVRQALGGEARLNDVRGVRASGRAARNVGPLRVESTIEWWLEPPDRFVRVDRLAAGGVSSEVAVGFNGNAVVQRAAGPGGVRVDPSAALPPELRATSGAALVAGARQDLARLLLGFFGASPVLPVQFALAGIAEAPEGRADVIAAQGDAGFEARLFVDAATRLPLMVTWMGPDLPGMMRALAGGAGVAPPAGREDVLAAGRQLVEHRLYFSDYRRTGGVRWPFRIRRSVAGEVVEEITFDRFVLNPHFDADAFAPAR